MARADYMLAALDMDGTLLNSDHQASPRTRATLALAAERGKLIALSTGRAYSELKDHLAALPSVAYVIGESGGWIYDVHHDRVLREVVLPDAEVAYIFDAVRGLDALAQVFVNHQCYFRPVGDAELDHYHMLDFAEAFRAGSIFRPDIEPLCRNSHGRVGKINFYFASAGDKALFDGRMAGRPVAVADGIGIGTEISPVEATKALGLQILCDCIGVPVEKTIAVGDGGNDLDIMAAAGFSVAMGNAIEPVRAAADAVTDDCDHDGCAKALEKYLLGMEF